MPDLTDALATCRTMWQTLSDEGWEYDPELADLETVMAAARRVADAPEWLQRLLEDSPHEPVDIWWCEEHLSGLFKPKGTDPASACDWYRDQEQRQPCRMVRRPLLKPEGHE